MVVEKEAEAMRAALQPLVTLVNGDESSSIDERIKARRNQIGLLRVGVREDLDKKCHKREAS